MSTAKAATKTAMLAELATKTELTKKEVAGLFEALTTYISSQVGKKGPGIVAAIPGLVKIKRVEKKATPARPGRNPITGETITIAAKPKRTVVKAQALKALKEMVK
jgi:nucleoid DNA-binding protein